MQLKPSSAGCLPRVSKMYRFASSDSENIFFFFHCHKLRQIESESTVPQLYTSLVFLPAFQNIVWKKGRVQGKSPKPPLFMLLASSIFYCRYDKSFLFLLGLESSFTSTHNHFSACGRNDLSTKIFLWVPLSAYFMFSYFVGYWHATVGKTHVPVHKRFACEWTFLPLM